MGRLNPIERQIERFLREPPTIRSAAGVIVTATGAVVVAAGVVISLLDHDEYPNVGVGMWWALQTITTVGYGDVTPSELSGRLVAAVVMLQGVAFVAIITAVITSTFITRATKETEATRAQDESSDRAFIEKRFDELERKLDVLMADRGEGGA